MNFKIKSIACAALACLAWGAQAQSSANLDITGQILPGACTVSIAGGVVNAGSRTQAQVMADNTYPDSGWKYLHREYRNLNVACDGPSTVAIGVTDPNNVGMGTNQFTLVNSAQSNAPIGFFSMAFGDELGGGVTLNGAPKPASHYIQADGLSGTPTWYKTTTSTTINAGNPMRDTSLAFAADATSLVPIPVQTLTIPLRTDLWIAEAWLNSQAAAGTITLSGRATFTIRSL